MSDKEIYARYVQGYSPGCGFTLKEWFEAAEYVRKNKIKGGENE